MTTTFTEITSPNKDGSFIVSAAFTDADGNAVTPNMTSYSDTFEEDFADDTGFTYTASEAEFSGGQVQQVDQRPSGSTFFANYNTDIDGTWGDGTLTGTGTGSPSVSGGFLDLTGGTLKYVSYPAASNADFTQTFTIKFLYKPNYSGSPVADRAMFSLFTAGLANSVYMTHSSAGELKAFIYNSAGGSIGSVGAAWSPTADTEYEIALCSDITTGATRLFVAGIQLGSTLAGTGTRISATNFIVGTNIFNNINPDFSIGWFLVSDEVLHTANYTPGSEPHGYFYKATNVDLPDFNVDTGDGSLDLLAYTAFSSMDGTGGGTPKYIIEGKYWNGSAWVTSDDTYAQANTEADVNTNIATLAAGNTVSVTTCFTDSNTQSYVSNLSIDYTAESYGAFWSLTDDLGNTINSRSSVALTEASTVSIVMQGDDLALQSVYDSGIRNLLIAGNYDDPTYGNAIVFNDTHQFVIPDLQQPITVDEAKLHMRISANDEDVYISRLIGHAVEFLENRCRRKLMNQTATRYYDSFPAGDRMDVDYGKLQSVTSLKYTDNDGTQSTMSSDDYIVDTGDDFRRGAIVLGYNKSWPTATLYPSNAVELTYVCGYGADNGDVPEMLRVAILQLVEHYYSFRGPELAGSISKTLWNVNAIISQYTVRPW